VKSTAVGGEERGYDGGKKVKGRKRRILVDAEGFVLSRPRSIARRCWTRWGSRCCYKEPTKGSHASRTCGWRRASAERTRAPIGCARLWVERGARRAPQKASSGEEVLTSWAKGWAKEGVAVDWRKLMPPEGFLVLPRGGGWWSARCLGSTSRGGSEQRLREAVCERGGVGVRCAMVRFMMRRLARA
jgi:putative transposase